MSEDLEEWIEFIAKAAVTLIVLALVILLLVALAREVGNLVMPGLFA